MKSSNNERRTKIITTELICSPDSWHWTMRVKFFFSCFSPKPKRCFWFLYSATGLPYTDEELKDVVLNFFIAGRGMNRDLWSSPDLIRTCVTNRYHSLLNDVDNLPALTESWEETKGVFIVGWRWWAVLIRFHEQLVDILDKKLQADSPTVESLKSQELPYLQQVLDETLR